MSPLPRPTFFEHLDPPLSTKREKVLCFDLSSCQFSTCSQKVTFLLQQIKGIQKRVPRLVRSVQSVSRFSDRYELRGPRFIRFTTKGKTPFGKLTNLGFTSFFLDSFMALYSFLGFLDGENAYYDKNDPREYFEQCFEKERKIGEGSFGEVWFMNL